jgi:hypothetical protein
MMVKRVRPFDVSMTAACSWLMGLVLLALLCLGRPDAPAFTNVAPGGASISLEQHRDAAALLRVTGKSQGLEVRAGRPVSTKFVSGNPGALQPAAVFVSLAWTSPAKATAVAAGLAGPRSNTNQPRAPPST